MHHDDEPAALARRDFLRGSVAAVVAASLGACAGVGRGGPRAPGALATRPIPSSGEALPIVGLGTNAYSVTDPAELAKREAVIARLVALGASVIDTARSYGDSERVVAGIVHRLDVRDRVFLATKTPSQGDVADAAQVVAETFRRNGTDVIDLLQIHNMHGTAELMPTLLRLRAERRVRYVGVTSSRDDQYPQVLAAMREFPLDFVQVDYSIANRNVAAEILPLAVARKIGVLVNLPYGGRRDGNLLRKLADRPLPPWAGEIGAASWAEVLLKYVLSNPAVTCAIPGTTSVANLESNVRAASGPLPDAALRLRMEEYWDGLQL